jgi:coxsackievirus/adenovirus receptor
MGVTGDKCDVCETGFFNLTEFGCEDCMCNVNGSVNASCSTLTGECFCKMGVVGRKCDMCDAFHFNFTDAGCERVFA